MARVNGFTRYARPHRFASPVRDNVHPLVKELFARMDADRVSLCDVAERAGHAASTLCGWKQGARPTLHAFEDVLNALGYELAVRERSDR